ncbi:MAG TPA: hypothetical protein PKA40_18990, partial [Cyclobacteriaceae bacterium]|nr:hypothetical protein [Cyclobacteriaceae bacterium]
NKGLTKKITIAILLSLIVIVFMVWRAIGRERELFSRLYKNSFCPKPYTVIKFSDSTSYVIFSGVDSIIETARGNWRVDSDLLGTYLIFDAASSPYKLNDLSENCIRFSRGEFEPKFVPFDGDIRKLTYEHWSSVN